MVPFFKVSFVLAETAKIVALDLPCLATAINVAPNGRIWKKDYGGPSSGNNRNRVVKITNERGYYRTYSWDAYGNLLQRRDEGGFYTTFAYEHPTIRNLVTRRIEPDADQWEYQYDPVTGDLLAIIDPLNEALQGYSADRVLSFSYETYPDTAGIAAGGNLLPGRIQRKMIIDRNGHVTLVNFDTSGNRSAVTRDPGVLNLVRTFQSDAMGRRTRRTIQRGDRDVVMAWSYDHLGRLLTAVKDPGAPPANLNLLRTWVYDGHGNLDTFTNSRGVVTKYTHDHRNRRKDRTHAYGTLNMRIEWYYDGNGNVIRRVDAEGHETTWAYNGQDFPTQTVDAEGYVTILAPDDVGNIRRIDRGLNPGTGGPLYSVERTFDALDRVAQLIVDPVGLRLITKYEYATSGISCGCSGTPGKALLSKRTDPAGKVTYFRYDKLDRLTTVVRKVGYDANGLPFGGDQIDGDDAVHRYEYAPGSNLGAVVRPEGERTEFVYDSADRRTQIRALHDGGTLISTLGHDGAGNVTSVTLPNGNIVAVGYDAANRLESASDNLGLLVDLSYDSNGNVIQRSTAVAGQTWRYEYDEVDRLRKLFDPIIESPDKFTEFVYSGNASPTEIIDANGARTRYSYDNLNRLVSLVENYQGADGTANTYTTYAYNGIRRNSISDHDGNTTSYLHDSAGRLRTIEYPDNNPPGSGAVQFDYNSVGKITWRRDQRGIETAFTYDDLYQWTGRSYSTGRSEAFTFDRSGRLLAANNDLGSVALNYDELGRVATEVQHYSGGPTLTTQFDYVVTAGDVRRILTYPSGRVVNESYDLRLRLAGIDGGAGVGTNFTYDLADRRTGATLGNGVVSTFGLDLADRLTSIRHARNATTLFDIDYGFDAIGNRVFQRNNTPGLGDRSEVYEYDQRYRLRSMDRGEISAGPSPAITNLIADSGLATSQDWTVLDRRGNWNEFAETIGVTPATTTQARAPNGVNEYDSIDLDGSGTIPPINLVYDANGNLTTDPTARSSGDQTGVPTGQRYEYDEENRLIRVRRDADGTVLLEIAYDAIGRRIRSTDSLTAGGSCGAGAAMARHVYAGRQVLEEYLSCNDGSQFALAREFVWGDQFPQPVAFVTHGGLSGGFGGSSVPPGESTYHYLHDSLGGVVALTNAAGQVVERYTYDPYGKTTIEATNPVSGFPTVRLDASAFGNPFAWTAQRYDAGTQLYYFAFRAYSPHLGRWLQRDPLDYIDGVNLLEYVRGRALSSIDPLGLSRFWRSIGRIVVGIGSGALGGAISGGIVGSLTPPINIPVGTAAGAVAGAAVGLVAGGITQALNEISSAAAGASEPTAGDAALSGLKNGAIAGVVPGAMAAAAKAEIAVSVYTVAVSEGGLTFVAVSIETEGDFGQATAQAFIAMLSAGLGGSLEGAGDPIAAFMLGLDISIITDLWEDATRDPDCD